MPKKIQICGQLIHSDYIEESMRVVNDDVRRYHISDVINEYEVLKQFLTLSTSTFLYQLLLLQVFQILELNVATLKFEKYSNPFICSAFSANELDTQFELQFQQKVIRRGTINSILYWYSVNFFNDQNSYSTLHEFSYVHQAAYLTKFPVTNYEDDKTFTMYMYYHHGTFLIGNLKPC